jgi:hypothetical protein
MEIFDFSGKRKALNVVMHVLFALSLVTTGLSLVKNWETATWWIRAGMWVCGMACLMFWRYAARDPKAPPTKLEVMVVGDGPYKSSDEMCRSCGRKLPRFEKLAVAPLVAQEELAQAAASPPSRESRIEMPLVPKDIGFDHTTGRLYRIPAPPPGDKFEK